MLFGFKYGETQRQHGQLQTQRWHQVNLRLKLIPGNKKLAMVSRHGMALHMTQKAAVVAALPTSTPKRQLQPPGLLTTT